MYRTDLGVIIGGLQMKNPVMPASGAYDYFDKNANVFPMDTLGAIVLKSVHRHPRPGNASPRIVEVDAGMINAVGIPTNGIEYFIQKEKNLYTNLNVPVILSLSGSKTEDYFESAELLKDVEGLSAIELNLSCPNVGTGLTFASDEKQLIEVVQGVRLRTKLPLFAKLSPNVTDIGAMVCAAEEGGADAAIIANTFLSMTIDVDRQRPYLGNIMGGLSGPCIRPIVLRMVYQAYKKAGIPIIACGGITRWQDAAEYMLAGAAAVQVGCGNFVNPLLMKEVIEGLDAYLWDKGMKSVAQLRGKAHDI